MSNTTSIVTTTSDSTAYIKESSEIDSISDLDPESLIGLFGKVKEVTNNSTLTNTHYTVPRNCSNICPEGQCFSSVEEILPFNTSSITLSTASREDRCRRIVAVYLRGNTTGFSEGPVVPDWQVRRIESRCGIRATCAVRSIGDYPSVLKTRINPSLIFGASSADFAVQISWSFLLCNRNFNFTGLITEKIVYEDGACSSFEGSNCLHENSLENAGDFILKGNRTIDNDITIDNYIEQNCPAPVCGSEYCIESTDISNTDMKETTSTSSANIGGIVGGVITSIFILVSIVTTIVATILLFKFNKIDKSILLKAKAKINKVLGRTSTVVSDHEVESKTKSEDIAV